MDRGAQAAWSRISLYSSELKRSYSLELSRPTIEKALRGLGPRPRPVRKLARKHSKRYAREIPGERVQMDTCKIDLGPLSIHRD